MGRRLRHLLICCGWCGTRTHELIRAPLEAVLRGDTHLQLARSLLSRGDVLNRLIEAEFTEDAPVLVPLCWSTAEWSAADLAELQWAPLVAAQQARTAELRSLAEQHARPEYEIFGRLVRLIEGLRRVKSMTVNRSTFRDITDRTTHFFHLCGRLRSPVGHEIATALRRVSPTHREGGGRESNVGSSCQ